MQANIQAASTHQLFVCAVIFDHAFLIQLNNLVNPFERGDAVRNEDDRLIREVLGQYASPNSRAA